MLMLALLLPLLQESATAPVVPPVLEPTAAELLATIATAQYAQHADREVHGFSIELQLREFGVTPHDFGLGLSYSTARGGNLTLQIDDPERGGRVRKGFDGTRHWLQEADGPIQDLGAHEFEQDRDSIEEALELSADLLLALDFASLARRATELRLQTGPELEKLIGGKVQRGGHTWDFTLVLPAKLGALGPLPSDLFLRKLNPDPKTREEQPFLLERHIAFTHYKRFKERAVPQLVHEFLPGEIEPARTLELHDLRWSDAKVAD